MSRRDGPDVYVTLREDRGALLVRGRWAQDVARQVAPERWPPRWSDAGRGWVLPARCRDDVLAYCQDRHWLAVVTDETPRDRAAVAG